MNKFLNLILRLKNLFVKKENNNLKANVAKLVNALDLGPSNFCFESSSLSIRNFRIYTQLRKFVNY